MVLNGAEVIAQFGEKLKGEILNQVGDHLKQMGMQRNAAGDLNDPTLTT